MNENGWTHYLYRKPPNVLCEFQTDAERFLAYPKDLHPAFNIAGLYWRLTGIGRRELEQMTPEQRLQKVSLSIASLAGIQPQMERSPHE